MQISAAALRLACVVLILHSVAGAQSTLADAEHQLSSSEWQTRARAFALIDRDPANWKDPRRASLLLTTVRREDALQRDVLRASNGTLGVVDRFGEEYGEYTAQALDECLRYCDKGGILSTIVADASFGPTRRSAVELLGIAYDRFEFSSAQRVEIHGAMIAAAGDTTSFLTRASALSALGEAIRSKHPLTPAERERVHRAVVNAAADPVAEVRIAAVRRIGDLADPRDRSLLIRLQDNDPAQVRTANRVGFPVRDAAAQAISRLNSPAHPD